MAVIVALIAVLLGHREAHAQIDTPAARDARRAIRELHEKYGRLPDWSRWLRQSAIAEVEHELRAGDRAEAATLAAVGGQMRGGSATFFKPAVFQRLANALEARAAELAPVPASEWASVCRARAETYESVTPQAIRQARQVLAQRLDEFEKRLPSLRRPGDRWREFLFWTETHWLATSDVVDSATLDRLETRWQGALAVWDESELVEASLAVQSYVHLLRSYVARESQDTQAAAWQELATLLEAREQSSGADIQRIAAAVTQRERLGQSSALTASIRRELSRPNIVVRVRGDWLQSLFERPINERYQVNDVFAGARSIGSGTLSANTRLRVLPSNAVGHWILSMDGSSTASSTGYGNRVRVASHATTKVRCEKQFTLDARGLTPQGATAQANTAIVYDRIDAEGLAIRRNEATRQTYARRGQAEAESAAATRRSVAARMDAQGAEMAERFSRTYREQLRDPQVGALRRAPDVRVRASADRVRWECRLEGPAKFAAPSSPGEFEPEADVVLSVAASALEEQSVPTFAGRTMTAGQLSKVIGELTGETSQAPTGRQEFTAVFAEHPCDFMLIDGEVRAKFYMTSFHSDDARYPAMTVEARYKLEENDGGVVLVRQGSVQVTSLARGDENGQPTGGRNQTLRLAAQRKLNKALPEKFVWSARALESPATDAPKLRVRRAQAEAGWLQLALTRE